MRPIPFSCRDFLPPSIPRATAAVLDRLTGLATLQRIYRVAGPIAAATFPGEALSHLGVTVDAGAGADLGRVPATGPLLIVANHPHGALDGLALASVLGQVRADVKLLGNRLLDRIPEMRPHLVPIDAFGPRTGAAANSAGLRAALQWLRDGHALILFPAGEVSHVRAATGRVVDGAWRDGAARLAARADAPVLPVFVDGRNSALFVAAGLVSPLLRSALLARELLRQRGRRIAVSIGRPVSQRRLRAIGGPGVQTAYLRVRTYGLAARTPLQRPLLRHAVAVAAPRPIAPAVPAQDVAAELAALPRTCRLIDASPWHVIHATASQAPLALREIARLRETTFRAAGEGTGRSLDTDRFDAHYRHLFVWHCERQMIAGAYRLAATDDVLARHGLAGLYTRTLFRYPQALLRDLGPALELGRSFVRREFQRDYQPLLLLWRGIGALVAAEPRYRTLFGPVSVSAEYGPTTRQLLARLLLASRGSLLQSFVVPRRPLRSDAADGADALVHSRVAGNLSEVEAIVRELESDRRGLPVLLRHYLRLNAKLLGFSVDPAFGDVMDGLVVVDLLDVDRALLNRYLGRDAARAFRAAHGGSMVAGEAVAET